MDLLAIPCRIDLGELVADDDGFVSFGDAPAYSGFVGDDWELDDIFARSNEASAAGTLAVQYVGQADSDVEIDVRSEPSGAEAFAEYRFPLTITHGALWVTSYADLTMVAMYEDETLADQTSTTPVIALDDGNYTLTFRWLTHYDEDTGAKATAELVVAPGRCPAPATFPGQDAI